MTENDENWLGELGKFLANLYVDEGLILEVSSTAILATELLDGKSWMRVTIDIPIKLRQAKPKP